MIRLLIGARLVGCLLATTLALFAWADGPRQHIRFDDNWKFRKDAPIVRAEDRIKWEWQLAKVTRLDAQPDQLGNWTAYKTGQQVLRRAEEFGWFRADLGSGALGGRVLHFESVDDNATVYLNGTLVAKQIGYGVPFDAHLEGAWMASGSNEVLVLIENTGGTGGINGSVTFDKPDEMADSPAESQSAYSDGTWRTVHLPHDYVVEGTFSSQEDPGHGSLSRVQAWYRKSFEAPRTWQGKHVWVNFDGVYRNSDVYLNGTKLGHWKSGYIGFQYDLSSLLKFGAQNVLAVRVDPRRDEGWWYEGAGIYRHVWMNVSDPVHIPDGGVFVRATPSGDRATVTVDAEVMNSSSIESSVTVRTRWVDPSGKSSPALMQALKVPAQSTGTGKLTLEIASPALWTLEKPKLYRLETQVVVGSKVVDQVSTIFGVRSIRFDKDQGFLLNEKPVKIQGTCNHQDHAGVGTAMPDSLLEWRLAQLKKMGSNAYRCSHNPPAQELLDDCDKMGILVMDETRHFGDTSLPKSPPGTKGDDHTELSAMIRRDRNHPSIVIWSLYNEEPLQGTMEGGKLFVQEREVVDSLDGTRPCAGATNYGYDRGIVDVDQIYGINYAIGEYEKLHKRKPDLPLFGSETASTVSTRGEYINSREKGYVSAYDVNYPAWAATAEHAWQPLGEHPWMAGGFVWTGFDYKGEPTPYEWPCINSHFGIMDIAGFPKDNFYYYQSVWMEKPMVHLLPSWNGPVKSGEAVDVWAYSNGDAVELFLNRKSLGKKAVPTLDHVQWSVPYQPGTLTAKAFKGDRMIAVDEIQTTGPAVAIRLKTDRTSLMGDGEDLTVVQVELLDSKGRVVPDAANDVHFTVTGAAQIGGVGNGDPSDHDPDKADHRKAFHGLCMALIQSNGTSGGIEFRAEADGLKGASLTLGARGSRDH